MFGKIYVMYFLLLFKWIAFAFAVAIMEGYMYDVKDPNKPVVKDRFILGLFNKISFGLIDHNEHTIFNIVRFIVAVGFLYGYPLYAFLAMAIVYVLTFPFIHDGTLYWTRNRLNPWVYRRGFMSEPSSESTSNWKLSFKVRTVLFIVGIILVLFYEFFNL